MADHHRLDLVCAAKRVAVCRDGEKERAHGRGMGMWGVQQMIMMIIGSSFCSQPLKEVCTKEKNLLKFYYQAGRLAVTNKEGNFQSRKNVDVLKYCQVRILKYVRVCFNRRMGLGVGVRGKERSTTCQDK
jgi:hypothetical protein